MANNPFPAAPGYGQFPTGEFSPTIYSSNILEFFRTANVVDEITTTRYEGEIVGRGSEIRIMKEPLITVQKNLGRGGRLITQDMNDEDLVMIIDQDLSFRMYLDDIEKVVTHLDWASLAQDSGSFSLVNNYDQDILEYMRDNATQGTGTGTDASPVTIDFGPDETTPLNYINKFKKILDQNDVPPMGRYFVASPEFYEKLREEDSSIMDVSYSGDAQSMLRESKLGAGRMIHGFMMLQSNNLPQSTSNSREIVLAGHVEAVATANALTQYRTVQAPDQFGFYYDGQLVFGRKLLRPEALFIGHYQ